MFVDTLLAFVIVRWMWKWPLWQALLAARAASASLDVVFISSNLLKIPDGAWLPLVLGVGLVVIMWTWTRGAPDPHRQDPPRQRAADRAGRDPAGRAPPLPRAGHGDLPDLRRRTIAPVALMHNLKHNKVLHEKNVILTVETAETPRVRDDDRIRIEPVNDDFKKVIITYGFMESPNLPKALALCRKQGLKFDIMATSFFLGRRSVVPVGPVGHAAVAGQAVHLPDEERRQPDRLLQDPARPGGRAGRPGHRLRAERTSSRPFMGRVETGNASGVGF